MYQRNRALIIHLSLFNQVGLQQLNQTLILMDFFRRHVWDDDDDKVFETRLETWGVDKIITDKLEYLVRELRNYIEYW